MEQVSAQTEKITTYETSRTRRSIVDGNVHSDDSNNDEEFATSGFYVREKSSDKKPDSSDSGSKDCKETNNEVKENGIASDENSSSNLVTNGETSKDGENSRDSKPANEENNEAEPENKDDPETDKEAEESNEQEGANEESKSKSEENNVTSSSSNEVEENACSTSKTDEENDVSSTSRNVDEPETLESVDESKKLENGNEVESVSENNIENAPKVDEKETVSDESKEETTEIVDDESKPEETEKVDVLSKDDKNDESIPEEKEKVDVVSKDDKKDESIPEEKEKVDVVSKDDKKDESIPKEKEKVDAVSKDDKKDESIPEEKEKVDVVSKDDTVDLTENETSDCKEDPKENDKKENDETSKGSILKEQLEKASNGNEENSEHEMDMDEDFDPSLLCPDISMDVDEAPVNTNTEPPTEDGSVSPLPYEPIFSTLVDEITGAEVHIDLTPAEMELRQKMFGPNNPVQTTKVHCTACNVHLGSALTGANNRFVHPMLKVLICKNCYHFYTSGEFEKDEDGSELYCRWCGQGGQVLCCSSCEYVFCKRCIRNNFGQRKFKVIRDSEDWNCFICEPEQLSNLRASCAEFMEYYRTELARAQSMADKNPELMTTDYTKCCSSAAEKKDDAAKAAAATKSRRKRKDNDDPDFVLDEDEPPVKKPAPTSGPGYTVIPPGNVRPIVPKPIQPMVRPATSTASTVFKVGSTTFKTKTAGTPGYNVQKPSTSQIPRNNSPGYITIPPTAGKTATTSPGYIKIIPQRMNAPPNRTSGTYTVVSGTSNGKPTFNTVRAVKPANQMPTMKHEWFEKTVRAAARVNSNLSYTLTQLNRQQSQAVSVEGLAMVHNKLQEVLSTSINSLIQIRKNLRTEFIAGIKNIKFPPKPAPIPATSGPIVVKDDDDVIFVNPTTTTASQPPPLVLSPSITLSKKGITVQRTSDPFSNPKPSTSGLQTTNSLNKPAVTTTTPSPGPIKRGFLKVRSFTALQSVPSECITIPDDPLPAPIVVEEEDPLKLVEDDPLKVDESKQPEVTSTSSAPAPVLDLLMVYNVKEKPTREIQKMMNAVVLLRRSPEVEKQLLLKGLIGGDKKKGDSDSKKNVQRENGIA